MGFAAYTDWLQAPATTGQVTYTVTGFGYLPKLLILRANGLTTSNGGGFDALMGVGAAASSSNQVAVFTLSAHNQESPFVRRGASGSDCILVRDGSGAVILQASLVSFALDGDDAKFTLDWSVTAENAHVQFDLIGGDDVEASVALFLGNSSSVDVPHGLSDAPTALMALTMGTASTNPTFVANNAHLAVGVSDLTTSRCVGAGADGGSGTSMTQRSWTSDLIHFRSAASGGTLLAGDVASVDATNVTLAFSATGNRNGFLIAMRGVQAHVGETTIPAAGNLTISGCPFQPAYGMFLSPCGEGSGDDARMMIGAAGSATGSRSMSIGIAEQDNQDITNARRWISQNIAVNYRDHAGNIVFTGMVDEFTVDGADIIMSVNPSDGLDYVLGYMFLAEAASGAYSLTADVASFALTGQAAGITAQRKLTAAAGSFSLAGQAVTLIKTGSYSMTAEVGSLSLTGQSASLTAARKLAAEQQAYTLDGQAVGLAIGRMIAAATAEFVLTGQDVTLSYSGDDVAPTVPGVELRLGSERLHYRVEE